MGKKRIIPSIDRLKQMSYKQIRNGAGNRVSDIYIELRQTMKEQYRAWINLGGNRWVMQGSWICVVLLILFFILFEIFFKVFMLILPYIIIGNVQYYDDWDKIDSFQLTLLLTYIVLQCVVFIFGIIVFRIHWFIAHIQPQRLKIQLNDSKTSLFVMKQINKFYDPIFYPQRIQIIIFQIFGDDVGNIILDYIWCDQIGSDYSKVNMKKFNKGDFY